MNNIPNHCPHCQGKGFQKFGFFKVRFSGKRLQRYRCSNCGKTFSYRTQSPTYRQKKPYLNRNIFHDLISGVTQRRCAMKNHCTRTTVHRKLLFLASIARAKHTGFTSRSLELQFDEMLTIENTKLKPLSIALAVTGNYEILSCRVGRVPSTGRLAAFSVKKYGPRPSETPRIIAQILREAKAKLIHVPSIIKSDAKPEYKSHVRRVFPVVKYEQFVGRGEKEKQREALFNNENKKRFDPLFALNQRCAKLRADIRRLTRRSWCVTRVPKYLEDHIYLFIAANNGYKLA